MRTTANLWEVLCRDLNAKRARVDTAEVPDIARQFREAAERILRPKSPRMCDAVEIAGDVCQSAGFPAEAARHLDEALRQNVALRQDAAAARVATKLAILRDGQGDVERARQLYRQALQHFDLAHDHSHDCMLLSNLASLERRSGFIDDAVECYEQALDRAARMFGEVHPEVALACNNLGVALTDAGDYVRAENIHLRALGIREKAFGAMHPDVAQSLGNLAVVYHSAGDLAKAEAYYKAALQTYAVTHHPDDPELASVKENYGKLHQSA